MPAFRVKLGANDVPLNLSHSLAVRPNLLSTTEMLSNWTDGRISCRHSLPTPFLVLYSTISVFLNTYNTGATGTKECCINHRLNYGWNYIQWAL